MSVPSRDQPTAGPPSPIARRSAQLRLCAQFYLGLHAPARKATYADCRVRAAADYEPDLIRDLFLVHRGQSDSASITEVNFRCWILRPRQHEGAFFLKRFPRRHALHDMERYLHCSRVDRAWRAAHLFPRLGLLTPKATGTILTTEAGAPVEYLITEWVSDGLSFHHRLRATADSKTRSDMLQEFARQLRYCHDRGIYLRDLVTNVLTQESAEARQYWLTDLDQFHPLRGVTRGRLLHQIRQLARWTAPLTEEEITAIVTSYLGISSGRLFALLSETLRSTPASGMDNG
ncbi:MAG: hypothetical protein JXA57_14385 [Armatimonadetes bacterium]|nr:hypothetical protein [Armatimonadota bacterium]